MIMYCFARFLWVREGSFFGGGRTPSSVEIYHIACVFEESWESYIYLLLRINNTM